MDVRITISYVSLKHYKESSLRSIIKFWLFYFKKYTFVKGFNLRVFGLNFNIREGGFLEKILKMNYNKKHTEVAERKTPQN